MTRQSILSIHEAAYTSSAIRVLCDEDKEVSEHILRNCAVIKHFVKEYHHELFQMPDIFTSFSKYRIHNDSI